jgi:pimeloyl-ACP methyl ester carboxylesterase
LVFAATGVALAQDRFFDSSGIRIRYVERGSGDAVVLIHGNGGSLQGWIDSGVLPALAQSYRVIALDARGHGKSGKPHEARGEGGGGKGAGLREPHADDAPRTAQSAANLRGRLPETIPGLHGRSNQDRFALAAVHREMKDQAVTPDQVRAIRVPTLGVVGSRDPYLPGFQELQKLRPAMKLVVIEGATHGTAMRSPEFLAAVREFLKSTPSETRSR